MLEIWTWIKYRASEPWPEA